MGRVVETVQAQSGYVGQRSQKQGHDGKKS